MGWVQLIFDGNKWPTVVTTVMNILVPYNRGNFFISYGPTNFPKNDPALRGSIFRS